tara:strand:+ start:349 stop:657 length:309 start_codon:yes stop_codon:yes gene_type:complete
MPKIKRKNKQGSKRAKVVPINKMTSDDIVKMNLLRMLDEQENAIEGDNEPQLIFDSVYWLVYMHLKRANALEKYHLILGLCNDAIGSAVREIFLEENVEGDE